MSGSWRPALRVAVRDMRRHKLATGLAALLVALPVLAAAVVSTVRSNTDWYSENAMYARMGAADAEIEVTRYEAVAVRYRDSGTYINRWPAQGSQTPTRNPDTVDLPSLLPEGSRLFRSSQYSRVRLDAGGQVSVSVLDLNDPISTGLGELVGGRAPAEPDEVAVDPAVADALDLVDGDGQLLDDTQLTTASGTVLRVVGLAVDADTYSAGVVVPPATVLDEATAGNRWLVDLPALTTGQLQDLRDDLAAAGVAALFRDAVQHPEHWPELERDVQSDQVDSMALAIGAIVVGFGMVEVVLLVGAALAVGARRQIRTLGLLASSGGSPRDVRRVVLARGLLVGGGGSVAGVLVGLVGLWLALPWAGELVQPNVHVLEVAWPNVFTIAGLGVVSGLLAAAYPAWVMGRITAVDALASRFPVGHRPAAIKPAAVAAVLVGLLGVVASGFWIAAEFSASAQRARGDASPSTVPVLAGGLALLALLAGLMWLTPYVVQRAGAVSDRLGLAGRLAVRDATRHRQRTTAATVGLTVTIAGAVFAGFGLDAAVADDENRTPIVPPDTFTIYAQVGDDRAESLRRLEATVQEAIGADALVELRRAVVDAGDGDVAGLDVVGARPRGDVRVVDETFLSIAGVDADALNAYRDGGVLVTQPGPVSEGVAQLRAVRRGETVFDRTLPATVVPTSWDDLGWTTGAAWISPETAAAIGAKTRGSSLLVHVPGGADESDAELLEVLGIQNDGSLSPSLPYSGRFVIALVVGAVLVTGVAVGVVVALAAAEGRDDAATLAAVGAPPGRRRMMGAAHGAFVGVLGGGIGLVLGSVAGASLLQAVGTPGTPVPWTTLMAVGCAVPVLAAAVGWVVTPSRVTLVRRVA